MAMLSQLQSGESMEFPNHCNATGESSTLKPNSRFRVFAKVIVVLGIALAIAYFTVVHWGYLTEVSWFRRILVFCMLFCWWTSPYFLYLFISRRARPLPVVIAGLFGITYDIALRVQTYSHRDSIESVLRTAVAIPVLLALVLMPLGMVVGWLVDKVVRRFSSKALS